MSEEKVRAKRIRTLDGEKLNELVQSLIAKSNSLNEDETINAKLFCKENNIVDSLFYQVYSNAIIVEPSIKKFEMDTKKQKKEKNLNIEFGKRGNIIIPNKLVDKINKDLSGDQIFKMGDEFSIKVEGDVITLTRIRPEQE